LQSRINRKNEKIDLLKIGLSGIAKRYGYQNVQDFCRIYYKAEDAYATYQKEAVKWEESYGEKSRKRARVSIKELLKKQPKQTSDYQPQQTVKKKDRGAR
jgi:hypothetical protein